MSNDKLLVKFLAGWIDARTMRENPQWLESWIQSAENAERQGFELVVFRIPKKSKTESGTAAVERLLQDMFPDWKVEDMFPDWEQRLQKLIDELPEE